MNYVSATLKGGTSILCAGLAVTVGAVLCSEGGEKAKNAANKRSLANEEVDGIVGAVFQKGISLLYWIGYYAEKSGSLHTRINPLSLPFRRTITYLVSRGLSTTQLVVAVFLKDARLLEYLVSHGADVNAPDGKGLTPLHEAVLNGFGKIVEYLVSHGADVNAPEWKGLTPLRAAVLKGHGKIIEYLVSHGADVNALNEGGKALLHIAAEEGDEAAVEDLIAKGADVNALTKDGMTALHIAAEKGHEKIVEYLLSKVADIDARDSYDWTPLHRASYHGKVSCLKLLLSKGVDPYALSKKGNTPLELAMQQKHDQVVDVLKEKFDLTRMVDGETILHRNVRLKQTTVAKAIIVLENNGINLPNEKYGATPLHLAAANGDRDLAEALIIGGALVGKKDHLGCTPMHIAALKNDESMILLLWNWWGKLDVPDLEGKTPMDRAKENSRPIYGTSVFDKMIGSQAEDLEEPWDDFPCRQFDERGKVLTDSNGDPIKFHFIADRLTSDVYEKVDTFWQVRSKALLTLLATPFYLPLSIGKQLIGIVLDIGKIAKQVFHDIAKQIKSLKLLGCLSAITITPIKNAAHAIALRIWQIASAPLYSIGMLYAALYTQVNQLNGRKMMNKMADGWNETGFLRIMGLAKLGNAAESERGGLAQFQ